MTSPRPQCICSSSSCNELSVVRSVQHCCTLSMDRHQLAAVPVHMHCAPSHRFVSNGRERHEGQQALLHATWPPSCRRAPMCQPAARALFFLGCEQIAAATPSDAATRTACSIDAELWCHSHGCMPWLEEWPCGHHPEGGGCHQGKALLQRLTLGKSLGRQSMHVQRSRARKPRLTRPTQPGLHLGRRRGKRQGNKAGPETLAGTLDLLVPS